MGHYRTPKTTAKKLNSQEKKEQILSLRLGGMLQRKIATQVGCTQQYVNKVLMEHVRLGQGRVNELAEHYRGLVLDRLEAQLSAIWEETQEGNLYAIDRVLRILLQEAKLLGLDMPDKVANTKPDGTEAEPFMTPEEMEARIKELVSKRE